MVTAIALGSTCDRHVSALSSSCRRQRLCPQQAEGKVPCFFLFCLFSVNSQHLYNNIYIWNKYIFPSYPECHAECISQQSTIKHNIYHNELIYISQHIASSKNNISKDTS